MPKRAHYLFAYDIGHPQRQYRIRKCLQTYAIGQQKSLYECWLTDSEYQTLCQQIHKLLSKKDRLLTFKIPPDSSMQLYGMASRIQYQPFMIV